MRVTKFTVVVNVEVPMEDFESSDSAFEAVVAFLDDRYDTQNVGYVSEEEIGSNWLFTFELEER